jgi:hypothetical protein
MFQLENSLYSYLNKEKCFALLCLFYKNREQAGRIAPVWGFVVGGRKMRRKGIEE